MKEKDTQHDKFQLTINNPDKTELNDGSGLSIHEKIIDILKNFATLVYACMADEMGSTYHIHLFLIFSSRVRFSTIKRHFPSAHIEPTKGTVSDNVNYIRKEGKWAETDKAETQIKNTFEEIGIRPADSKGKHYEMTDLYNLISDGKTNSEIISYNQDYILHLDKLDKLRTMLLTDRYKDEFREDIKVIYISGETGTGKTFGVMTAHRPSNVYHVTDYDHPFDSYSCQPIIAFDEFRSNIKLGEMLIYCDIYPCELPARYSNKYACYDTVYIISNWRLEDQYSDVQQKDQRSWNAFLRRIAEVWIYTGYNEVTKYESVDAYLNRTETIEALSSDIDIPFE